MPFLFFLPRHTGEGREGASRKDDLEISDVMLSFLVGTMTGAFPLPASPEDGGGE